MHIQADALVPRRRPKDPDYGDLGRQSPRREGRCRARRRRLIDVIQGGDWMSHGNRNVIKLDPHERLDRVRILLRPFIGLHCRIV